MTEEQQQELLDKFLSQFNVKAKSAFTKDHQEWKGNFFRHEPMWYALEIYKNIIALLWNTMGLMSAIKRSLKK